MKIIGGHDYYDSALAFGSDDSIVFVRHKDKTEAFEFLPLPNWFSSIRIRSTLGSGYWFNRVEYRLTSIYVYFCGKVYTGIWIQKGLMGTIDYIWDLETLNSEMVKLGIIPNKHENKILSDYFAISGTEINQSELINKRVTIAVFHSCEYDRNSDGIWKIDGFNLKEIKFFRVKNAFTAFQEISMWIGGVIPRDSPKMAKIVDEKIRIEKRGFDSRTSFRKEPTKTRHKTKRR